MRCPSVLLLSTLLCLRLMGCGSDNPTAEIVPTVPAGGILTYRGSPLANHEVIFYPTDGSRPAMGVTNEQGRFTLGTNKPGDGAVPGSHRITVMQAAPTPSGEPGKEAPTLVQAAVSVIPNNFSHPDTSGLTRTIPEAGDTDLKLDLQ